jgi:iron complex outermembrane receptor protein
MSWVGVSHYKLFEGIDMSTNRSNALHRAVRLALIGALLPASTSTVFAQEDTSSEELQRIQITGSRIKRAQLEGNAPVQVIDRDAIDQTGLTSIGDILQQLTASGSALNTRFNSSGNFGFPPDGGGVGAGSTTVDLRHLGAKRVLVLVDGHRWVNETSASGVSTAVDLNSIPLAIVDRIEVLEDGASAIYGSDAIGGVVNIITKSSFDGARINAQYGEYEGGDGANRQFDFLWGSSSDSTDIVISGSYVDQRSIGAGTREQSSFPVPGTGVAFGSSGTPNGRFIFNTPTPNSVCPGGACDITTPTGQGFPNGPNFPGDYIPFTTDTRFNFSPFNLLLTPNERTNVFAKITHDLSNDISWTTRVSYTERESTNRAAPEPIFLGPGAGTGNPLADNITISGSNPFNPFGFDLVSGDNFVLLGRRPIEGGPRVFNQNVETFYFNTGLEGSFQAMDRYFFWDLTYTNAENEAVQTTFGSYNLQRIARGLGPIDECTGNCVPLNLFGGPGTLTPEMLDYIQPILTDQSANNLEMISANLSGDLFELPAGPLSFAAGYEHREQDGFFQPDALIVAGESNGVPANPTSGEFDVDEAYVELNVPLLADMPAVESLDLSLATRYSDYSTFGSETTSKIGLRWQVSSELLLRGTYGEGFRAPSIGEAFGSDSRFDATLTDPCSDVTDAGLAANCAALGVPSGFQQANPQISVTTGGNPDLQAETADSYTLGAVWSPAFASDTSWSQRLDLQLSYYSHEIEGGIQAIDAQTQLDLCVETLDPQFCNGITRNSSGAIDGFANRLGNLAAIETDGFDASLFWTLPAMDIGQFQVSWRNTFVNDYEALGANGIQQPQAPGVEVNNSGIPEWSSNLGVDYSFGDWSVNWTMRHMSDLTEDCDGAASFEVCGNQAEGTNKLGSTTYNDLQINYHLNWQKGARFTVGVNNLFSKEPPICLSCSLNGYDPSTYDMPESRFVYMRASLDF